MKVMLRDLTGARQIDLLPSINKDVFLKHLWQVWNNGVRCIVSVSMESGSKFTENHIRSKSGSDSPGHTHVSSDTP